MRLLTPLVRFSLTLVSSGYAFPVEDNQWGLYQSVETIYSVPPGWQSVGRPDKSSILDLRMIVNSANENGLESNLMQIGTPGHAKYGKHLNQEQVAALIAPDIASLRNLTIWMSSFDGVSKPVFSSATSSISFQSTVTAATEMFRAEFESYHPMNGTGTGIIRALKYSIPKGLFPLVSLVHPVTYFPAIRAPRNGSSIANLETPTPTTDIVARSVDPELLAACTSILPACIAKLYNIDYTPPVNTTKSGSSLAIAGFLEQWIHHTDITNFVSKYGISNETRAHPGTFTVELVNGGTNNESTWAGIEATLDMEYSMPFTGSLPVVYYSVGGRPPTLDAAGDLKPTNQSYNEPYLEWLEYMLAKPDGELPQVISISYTDTEMGVPRPYALHVCSLFGRLAARGVSIINASGDGGIAGQNDFGCVSNDGLKTPQFLPTFPASCPWVTAVGSTSGIPERGSSFSSGGFSNYFDIPDYQVSATASFITSLNGQFDGLYNKSGRGIPDIAVYGSWYQTENNNVTSGHHSGTSAGTPVFAAMIALVNDIRLRSGKPVLGWLNPLLYSEGVGAVWNDVTTGTAYGCGEQWNATVGWDPITGLGTPDFRRLVGVFG